MLAAGWPNVLPLAWIVVPAFILPSGIKRALSIAVLGVDSDSA